MQDEFQSEPENIPEEVTIFRDSAGNLTDMPMPPNTLKVDPTLYWNEAQVMASEVNKRQWLLAQAKQVLPPIAETQDRAAMS